MKLVSACLMGLNCRYDGGHKANKKVLALSKGREVFIPVCPELAGGLLKPREPAEIVGGDGNCVLVGAARVMMKSGQDVTKNFINGAQHIIREYSEYICKGFIKSAILKQCSPSCGCGKIYDGTFSGRLIRGDGVFTALLKMNGIEVIGEENL